MSSHKIKIYTEALHDIQEATDWYNFKLRGLGGRYQSQVKRQINTLKNNPFLYTVRYTDVHCMLIKKFPFAVHFTINKKQSLVEVFAVYHTSRNPEIWLERKNITK
jgi:mRNA-degrading endonuclease RelE of RelBE toxin-antitoxin system